MKQPDSLDVIATPSPQFSAARVRRFVGEEYGLDGEFDPLVSERDQNFRLVTADKSRYVVKIANAAEEWAVTDFQIQALLHLESKACRVVVPSMVRTLDGKLTTTLSSDDRPHTLRVVTYVAGRPLEDVVPDERLAQDLGACVADLDIALSDFEHPGDSQLLLWDMQRASELRGLMSHITDSHLRETVSGCLDDFEQNAAPEFASLRSQIIHSDINPGNVLVTESEPASIAGVIDFGDMIRAPLIIDVAIAAAYLRSDAEDALAQMIAFVVGFDGVTSLEDNELALLYDLTRMRLATTITMLYWRLSARAEGDDYTRRSLQTEGRSERFLARINGTTREQFSDRIRLACGR